MDVSVFYAFEGTPPAGRSFPLMLAAGWKERGTAESAANSKLARRPVCPTPVIVDGKTLPCWILDFSLLDVKAHNVPTTIVLLRTARRSLIS